MQCCGAIICLLSFIFQPPAICYFYSALVLHTLHPYSHYCVFMQGYFRLCCHDRRKKEKRYIAPASYADRPDTFQPYNRCSSADGDSKRSSGVDDLARNEPPYQVLALTWRCHMWLHVPYGVYLVFESPKYVFIKIRKDIFYMNHHPVSTRRQIASQGTGRANDKPNTDMHHLEAN